MSSRCKKRLKEGQGSRTEQREKMGGRVAPTKSPVTPWRKTKQNTWFDFPAQSLPAAERDLVRSVLC